MKTLLKRPLQTFNLSIRFTAFALFIAFTAHTVLWADGAGNLGVNPGTSSQNEFAAGHGLSIELPHEIGQVKRIFQGSNPGLVIHIQDAHANEEAQKRIAEMIGWFSEKYKVRLVNLEGATGELAHELYGAFPDPKVREIVADYFLKEAIFTGAEYQAAARNSALILNGVEEPALYAENRQVFLEALEYKNRDEPILQELRKLLESLARHLFSEKLWELFLQKRAFEKEEKDLSGYLQFLGRFSPEKTTRFPQIQSFLALVNKEKEARPEESGNTAPDAEIERLTQSINQDIFGEMKFLESSLQESLFRSEDERNLARLFHFLDIYEKIFSFSLTKEDAEFFYKNHADFQSKTFLKFIAPLLHKYKFNHDPESLDLSPLDRDLPEVEAFYRIALQRDDVLISNALKKMNEGNFPISILITGGFHTPGIERILQAKRISYAVVIPRLTRAIDEKKQEELYRRAVRSEATHLSRLLTETRFLSHSGRVNDPSFQLSPESRTPPRSLLENRNPENFSLFEAMRVPGDELNVPAQWALLAASVRAGRRSVQSESEADFWNQLSTGGWTQALYASLRNSQRYPSNSEDSGIASFSVGPDRFSVVDWAPGYRRKSEVNPDSVSLFLDRRTFTFRFVDRTENSVLLGGLGKNSGRKNHEKFLRQLAAMEGELYRAEIIGRNIAYAAVRIMKLSGSDIAPEEFRQIRDRMKQLIRYRSEVRAGKLREQIDRMFKENGWDKLQAEFEKLSAEYISDVFYRMEKVFKRTLAPLMDFRIPPADWHDEIEQIRKTAAVELNEVNGLPEYPQAKTRLDEEVEILFSQAMLARLIRKNSDEFLSDVQQAQKGLDIKSTGSAEIKIPSLNQKLQKIVNRLNQQKLPESLLPLKDAAIRQMEESLGTLQKAVLSEVSRSERLAAFERRQERLLAGMEANNKRLLALLEKAARNKKISGNEIQKIRNQNSDSHREIQAMPAELEAMRSETRSLEAREQRILEGVKKAERFHAIGEALIRTLDFVVDAKSSFESDPELERAYGKFNEDFLDLERGLEGNVHLRGEPLIVRALGVVREYGEAVYQAKLTLPVSSGLNLQILFDHLIRKFWNILADFKLERQKPKFPSARLGVEGLGGAPAISHGPILKTFTPYPEILEPRLVMDTSDSVIIAPAAATLSFDLGSLIINTPATPGSGLALIQQGISNDPGFQTVGLVSALLPNFHRKEGVFVFDTQPDASYGSIAGILAFLNQTTPDAVTLGSLLSGLNPSGVPLSPVSPLGQIRTGLITPGKQSGAITAEIFMRIDAQNGKAVFRNDVDQDGIPDTSIVSRPLTQVLAGLRALQAADPEEIELFLKLVTAQPIAGPLQQVSVARLNDTTGQISGRLSFLLTNLESIPQENALLRLRPEIVLSRSISEMETFLNFLNSGDARARSLVSWILNPDKDVPIPGNAVLSISQSILNFQAVPGSGLAILQAKLAQGGDITLAGFLENFLPHFYRINGVMGFNQEGTLPDGLEGEARLKDILDFLNHSQSEHPNAVALGQFLANSELQGALLDIRQTLVRGDKSSGVVTGSLFLRLDVNAAGALLFLNDADKDGKLDDLDKAPVFQDIDNFAKIFESLNSDQFTLFTRMLTGTGLDEGTPLQAVYEKILEQGELGLASGRLSFLLTNLESIPQENALLRLRPEIVLSRSISEMETFLNFLNSGDARARSLVSWILNADTNAPIPGDAVLSVTQSVLGFPVNAGSGLFFIQRQLQEGLDKTLAGFLENFLPHFYKVNGVMGFHQDGALPDGLAGEARLAETLEFLNQPNDSNAIALGKFLAGSELQGALLDARKTLLEGSQASGVVTGILFLRLDATAAGRLIFRNDADKDGKLDDLDKTPIFRDIGNFASVFARLNSNTFRLYMGTLTGTGLTGALKEIYDTILAQGEQGLASGRLSFLLTNLKLPILPDALLRLHPEAVLFREVSEMETFLRFLNTEDARARSLVNWIKDSTLDLPVPPDAVLNISLNILNRTDGADGSGLSFIREELIRGNDKTLPGFLENFLPHFYRTNGVMGFNQEGTLPDGLAGEARLEDTLRFLNNPEDPSAAALGKFLAGAALEGALRDARQTLIQGDRSSGVVTGILFFRLDALATGELIFLNDADKDGALTDSDKVPVFQDVRNFDKVFNELNSNRFKLYMSTLTGTGLDSSGLLQAIYNTELNQGAKGLAAGRLAFLETHLELPIPENGLLKLRKDTPVLFRSVSEIQQVLEFFNDSADPRAVNLAIYWIMNPNVVAPLPEDAVRLDIIEVIGRRNAVPGSGLALIQEALRNDPEFQTSGLVSALLSHFHAGENGQFVFDVEEDLTPETLVRTADEFLNQANPDSATLGSLLSGLRFDEAGNIVPLNPESPLAKIRAGLIAGGVKAGVITGEIFMRVGEKEGQAVFLYDVDGDGKADPAPSFRNLSGLTAGLRALENSGAVTFVRLATGEEALLGRNLTLIHQARLDPETGSAAAGRLNFILSFLKLPVSPAGQDLELLSRQPLFRSLAEIETLLRAFESSDPRFRVLTDWIIGIKKDFPSEVFGRGAEDVQARKPPAMAPLAAVKLPGGGGGTGGGAGIAGGASGGGGGSAVSPQAGMLIAFELSSEEVREEGRRGGDITIYNSVTLRIRAGAEESRMVFYSVTNPETGRTVFHLSFEGDGRREVIDRVLEAGAIDISTAFFRRIGENGENYRRVGENIILFYLEGPENMHWLIIFNAAAEGDNRLMVVPARGRITYAPGADGTQLEIRGTGRDGNEFQRNIPIRQPAAPVRPEPIPREEDREAGLPGNFPNRAVLDPAIHDRALQAVLASLAMVVLSRPRFEDEEEQKKQAGGDKDKSRNEVRAEDWSRRDVLKTVVTGAGVLLGASGTVNPARGAAQPQPPAQPAPEELDRIAAQRYLDEVSDRLQKSPVSPVRKENLPVIHPTLRRQILTARSRRLTRDEIIHQKGTTRPDLRIPVREIFGQTLGYSLEGPYAFTVDDWIENFILPLFRLTGIHGGAAEKRFLTHFRNNAGELKRFIPTLALRNDADIPRLWPGDFMGIIDTDRWVILTESVPAEHKIDNISLSSFLGIVTLFAMVESAREQKALPHRGGYWSRKNLMSLLEKSLNSRPENLRRYHQELTEFRRAFGENYFNIFFHHLSPGEIRTLNAEVLDQFERLIRTAYPHLKVSGPNEIVGPRDLAASSVLSSLSSLSTTPLWPQGATIRTLLDAGTRRQFDPLWRNFGRALHRTRPLSENFYRGYDPELMAEVFGGWISGRYRIGRRVQPILARDLLQGRRMDYEMMPEDAAWLRVQAELASRSSEPEVNRMTREAVEAAVGLYVGKALNSALYGIQKNLIHFERKGGEPAMDISRFAAHFRDMRALLPVAEYLFYQGKKRFNLNSDRVGVLAGLRNNMARSGFDAEDFRTVIAWGAHPDLQREAFTMQYAISRNPMWLPQNIDLTRSVIMGALLGWVMSRYVEGMHRSRNLAGDIVNAYNDEKTRATLRQGNREDTFTPRQKFFEWSNRLRRIWRPNAPAFTEKGLAQSLPPDEDVFSYLIAESIAYLHSRHPSFQQWAEVREATLNRIERRGNGQVDPLLDAFYFYRVLRGHSIKNQAEFNRAFAEFERNLNDRPRDQGWVVAWAQNLIERRVDPKRARGRQIAERLAQINLKEVINKANEFRQSLARSMGGRAPVIASGNIEELESESMGWLTQFIQAGTEQDQWEDWFQIVDRMIAFLDEIAGNPEQRIRALRAAAESHRNLYREHATWRPALTGNREQDLVILQRDVMTNRSAQSYFLSWLQTQVLTRNEVRSEELDRFLEALDEMDKSRRSLRAVHQVDLSKELERNLLNFALSQAADQGSVITVFRSIEDVDVLSAQIQNTRRLVLIVDSQRRKKQVESRMKKYPALLKAARERRFEIQVLDLTQTGPLEALVRSEAKTLGLELKQTIQVVPDRVSRETLEPVLMKAALAGAARLANGRIVVIYEQKLDLPLAHEFSVSALVTSLWESLQASTTSA